MPLIRLTSFIGEQPKILPPNLLPNAATAAINVRLNDGGLTPVHRPTVDGVAGGNNHQSIYKRDGTWISWLGVVDAAPGPVDATRLYYTGNGGVPKLDVAGVAYNLKVPAPAAGPTAAPGGVGSGDVFTRTYVYTHVTGFGEESAPSPATAVINWQAGQTVTLSGISAVPAGRNITKQRFYRSQTSQSGTYFYFIAERAAGTGNFADSVAVNAFAEPLPSLGWDEPPDDLVGLTAMPNGMMAGFRGRELCFSEPYQPHAWPLAYRLRTQADIVGLGAIGNSLVVATKGNPEIAAGTHPSTMQLAKLEQNLPCINGRGIEDMGSVICYPTIEGLVAVAGDGSSRLVTSELFDRDSWLAYSPSTMTSGQIAGRYVAFFDTLNAAGEPLKGALFIDVGPNPYLIRSNAVAAATFYEVETGALYYREKGATTISQLDAPDGARDQYYWRSKEHRLPFPTNFGAIQIDSLQTLTGTESESLLALLAEVVAANAVVIVNNAVFGEFNGSSLAEYAMGGDALADPPSLDGLLSVGVYADHQLVFQTGRTGRPVRMPGGFKARTWEIDVAGDVTVSQIMVAATIDELRSGPA